jgi:hypothetical protein
VRVDFVHEFVEVVFVALAEVDEGLDCLVWVGGDVLLAAFIDNLRTKLVFKKREKGVDLRKNLPGSYHR